MLLLVGLGLGCAPGHPGVAPVDPPSGGLLRVRLVFGEAADLDLYVTDPNQETVYFANTPSVSGGALEEDLRCDAASPRVETVRFPRPLPGRYRIGIDYPKRCGVVRAAVPFSVVVERGPLHKESSGEITLGHFRANVLEIELPP